MPARKPYRIRLLFIHKNDDFGAISVTERSFTASISKAESHISGRCSCYTGWHSVAARKAIWYSVNIALGMFQEYDVLQFRVLTRFY